MARGGSGILIVSVRHECEPQESRSATVRARPGVTDQPHSAHPTPMRHTCRRQVTVCESNVPAGEERMRPARARLR